jgi:hypothetical protein
MILTLLVASMIHNVEVFHTDGHDTICSYLIVH